MYCFKIVAIVAEDEEGRSGEVRSHQSQLEKYLMIASSQLKTSKMVVTRREGADERLRWSERVRGRQKEAGRI